MDTNESIKSTSSVVIDDTNIFSTHQSRCKRHTVCHTGDNSRGIQHRVLTSGYNHRDTQNSAPTEDIHHDSEYN